VLQAARAFYGQIGGKPSLLAANTLVVGRSEVVAGLSRRILWLHSGV
jgi:hypothetical protein